MVSKDYWVKTRKPSVYGHRKSKEGEQYGHFVDHLGSSFRETEACAGGLAALSPATVMLERDAQTLHALTEYSPRPGH